MNLPHLAPERAANDGLQSGAYSHSASNLPWEKVSREEGGVTF